MHGRIRRDAFALLLIAAALPTPALAASLAKGMIEYQPSLSFSHESYSYKGTKLLDASTLDLTGLVGYCLSDLFEVQGSLIAQHSSFDDQSGFGSVTSTAVGGTLGVSANLATSSNAVPFLSVNGGFLSYSGDGYSNAENSLLAPSATAGVRLMIKSTASVNFTVTYEHVLNATGSKDVDGNNFLLGVGVSLFNGP